MRALAEERDCLRPRQRGDRVVELARDAKELSARNQDPQVRARRKQADRRGASAAGAGVVRAPPPVPRGAEGPVPHHPALTVTARITFLGTGTSHGVPMIGCTCATCRSDDPRDTRLRTSIYVEVPDAAITVSVLGPLEPMEADTAEEVARLLRLGVDGLLLRSGLRQATFLPAVAVSLPDPLDFVHFLERKAGWRPGEWPPGTRAYRYAAEEFGRPLLG